MAVIVCVDYQYHITMKPMVVRLIKEDIDSVDTWKQQFFCLPN